MNQQPFFLFGNTNNARCSSDEISNHIRTFLEQHIIDEGCNYEVEAKFGTFIDRNTNARIILPVMTSCVLAPAGGWYRFEADLSVEQHRLFNQLFNEQVNRSRDHWRYQRTRTIDTFYQNAQRQKVRVTRDQAGGKIIEVMDKRRIGDVAIYLPTCPFDIRISINVEHLINGITEDVLAEWPQIELRNKDRLSYTFNQLLRVDLTQIKQSSAGERMRHELEVEILHLQDQLQSDPVGLVDKFVSSVLDIARAGSSNS
jgi:hypothetical protein